MLAFNRYFFGLVKKKSPLNLLPLSVPSSTHSLLLRHAPCKTCSTIPKEYPSLVLRKGFFENISRQGFSEFSAASVIRVIMAGAVFEREGNCNITTNYCTQWWLLPDENISIQLAVFATLRGLPFLFKRRIGLPTRAPWVLNVNVSIQTTKFATLRKCAFLRKRRSRLSTFTPSVCNVGKPQLLSVRCAMGRWPANFVIVVVVCGWVYPYAWVPEMALLMFLKAPATLVPAGGVCSVVCPVAEEGV